MAGIVQHIEPVLVPEEQAVRLEIALQAMTTHTVELQGRQLHITLADTGNHVVETPPPGLPRVPTPAGQEDSVPASAASAGTRITGMAFETHEQRGLLSLVTTGAPPQVQVRQQSNPPRLALDIRPASLDPLQHKTLAVQDPAGVVTHVEALPVTDTPIPSVKVTVYLQTTATFEVQQDTTTIRLTLSKPAPTLAVEAASAPGPLPAAALAAVPSTRVSSTAARTPVMPRVAQIAPLVRRGASAAPAVRTDSAPVAERSEGISTSSSTDGPVYKGEKVSLDFQDADINDILRLIAEVGKVNIIAGGDVQGKVTTRMVDVPWDQALDVILKINGLAQERGGNIIRVAPLEKFTAERQERLKAQITEVAAEPLLTRIVPANYASAKELRPNLEKILSKRGTIIIDVRTNTMIITDTQKSLAEALSLIEKLDRPTPQVMIEARIVESTRTFLRELGIQLGLAHSQITDRAFPNRIDVRGGGPAGSGGGGLARPAAPANFLLDLPAAVATGAGGAIGFSLASIGGSVLDAQLSALESSGRGKIISSPKIATLDNTEAQIQSGRKIPVQTTSAEGTRTDFVDASITLKVTPHVTPNDFIGMKITATKNEADFSRVVNGIPTITTREANTDMLVKDGDTVVIGGLYRRTIQSNRAGIPGLSSLPVLGWLFRKDQEQDESDELLIFLTPRIIRQDESTGKRRATLSY